VLVSATREEEQIELELEATTSELAAAREHIANLEREKSIADV
jgi:hypothetical protein